MIFLTFNLIELTIKIGKKLPEKLEKIRKIVKVVKLFLPNFQNFFRLIFNYLDFFPINFIFKKIVQKFFKITKKSAKIWN